MRVSPALFSSVAPALLALCAPVAAAGLPAASGSSSVEAPYCSGEYADELSSLAPRVRAFERDPQNQYSYCLRTSATYECLSYATDGTVRRARKVAVAHGTGFAYRRAAGETYLVTNDHVATWPAVTDEEHTVEDVPVGCKLIAESVKIVDDEGDGYDADDLTLTRIVTDPSLDVAVLKTKAPLRMIPYKIGRSAALRVGNTVAVHGFPLGAFAATNVGKVVNAFDHDTERDWDHTDFVVDALLSGGGSGSPVLAVSCATGEYELVGIYHAGYVRGSALNVVVGIDQVRDMMATLKRTPRPADAALAAVGPSDVDAVKDALHAPGASGFFSFGPLVARARIAGNGALSYEVYSRGFPLHDERILVIEDAASPASPTAAGSSPDPRVFVGNSRGLRLFDRAGLDGDAQSQLSKIVKRLRAGAVTAVRFRASDEGSNKGHKQRAAIEKELSRQTAYDRDAAQSLVDLSDRLGPRPGEVAMTYQESLAAAPPDPSRPSVAKAQPPHDEPASQKAGAP